MEDPILFDVFGTILSDKKLEAVSSLVGAGCYPKEFEARMAVYFSMKDGSQILLANRLKHGDANNFIDNCTWATNFTLAQEGYSPDDANNYCREHNLHYGGILGCHICTNFYQK